MRLSVTSGGDAGGMPGVTGNLALSLLVKVGFNLSTEMFVAVLRI